MNKNKKLLHNLLMALLCLAMVMPTGAISMDKTDISPQYIVVLTVEASISIDRNGCSTCIGKCTTESNYTAAVTMELQQLKGKDWETIKVWTADGRKVTLEKNWYVDSGYDYRVKLSGVVTNSSGKVIEEPETHSAVKHY